MPREFESRVFSSETLLAGMDLVEKGFESFDHLDEEGLEEELRKLEEGWWWRICFGRQVQNFF